MEIVLRMVQLGALFIVDALIVAVGREMVVAVLNLEFSAPQIVLSWLRVCCNLPVNDLRMGR